MTTPLQTNVTPEGTTVAPVPPAGIPVTQPVLPSQPDQTFTAAQVEQFRNEEKAKLYAAQEALKAQQASMQAELDKYKSADQLRADEAKAAAEAASAAQKIKDEEELDAKALLAKREVEWEQRFAAAEAERARDRALLEKERQYSELQAYVSRRVAESRDDIEENLLDLVTGTTPEEVEASIVSMKQRSMRIMENARQNGVMTRAGMPGVSSAAGNVGPLDQLGGQREPSAEEIASYAPGSPEHLAARARYGIGRPQSPSMFG
jgi:hypothetical protein